MIKDGKKGARLGQHFLKDTSALDAIISAGEIKKGERILEIGPGAGALTERLLDAGAVVVAVEKDEMLCLGLREKFAGEIKNGSLTLAEEDIIGFEPDKLGLSKEQYKIIANIPYYITGQIIRLALSKWPAPEKAVLLVQKEVADRIVAKDGKESVLSISVKAFGKPSVLRTVKAGAFSPPPKVDSAILVISDITKTKFGEKLSEEKFFEVLKAGFAHKRKLLVSNIKAVIQTPDEAVRACKVPEKARPEELSLNDWECLAEYGQDER